MPRYVEVREFHGGLSRSANYFFVVDGSSLRHVSEYAVQRRRIGDLVKYEVDFDEIGGRPVVRIGATNSGIICSAWIYEAEDLLSEPPLGHPRMVQLSHLNGLHFSYLRPYERMFLEREWKKYYVSMLSELKSLVDRLKGLGVSVVMPSLIMCQVVSGADYPLSYLVPYSENAREKSLEGLTKHIHQAWVALRLISELQKKAVVRTYDVVTPELVILEQSSYHPAVVYESEDNVYSIWWEFDLYPTSMCEGALWSRGIPPALHRYY